MGVQKRTRKFAQTKRVIGKRDDRLKENREKADKVQELKKKATANGELVREIPQAPSSMFFQHNTALVPPYQVLVDTNFLIALRIARDERWKRLPCDNVHSGNYADDCIVDRCMKNRIYIVATNDRDLKRRLRKIPGVPILSVGRGKYVIERLPDSFST
ncbi:hypothetical protein DHEL01_v206242 [Diaporthe helianthi]|uniref:rRNA-processing protein FCF1 n=1 Tax=Diaporthe helianthi TaxID=158607 RepID=A0A2P5HYN0_DIAHE|nr:hypothetical protein DHEL01_v206242 [Diaporthe helianthi]